MGWYFGALLASAAGAGAGDAYAQHARDARIGVGHVAGAGLASGRDKADLPTPVEGVEDGHVVDRDHAIGGLDLASLQKSGNQLAHGDVL